MTGLGRYLGLTPGLVEDDDAQLFQPLGVLGQGLVPGRFEKPYDRAVLHLHSPFPPGVDLFLGKEVLRQDENLEKH